MAEESASVAQRREHMARAAATPAVTAPTRNGAELVAALRSGPLFDIDANALRDWSRGRSIDLE